MSYNKNVWENGDIITESKMNNIENGISDAHTEIEKVKQDGLTTAISVNGTTYTHSNGTITLPNYPTVPTDISNAIAYKGVAITVVAEVKAKDGGTWLKCKAGYYVNKKYMKFVRYV